MNKNNKNGMLSNENTLTADKTISTDSMLSIDSTLSIDSRNIFSILKKWLYTEQDIVFRELISNGIDAIEKYSHIAEEGTKAEWEGKVEVIIDKENSRMIIRDNGIGMTCDEVEKYINNIAFSGAEEFISQNGQKGKDTIIGHFGVGFYSAFMLADHVAIETKSYRKETEAVRWDCMADMSYRMKSCDKRDVGTDVILYLKESDIYLEKPEQAYEAIKKYFIFSRTLVSISGGEYDNTLVNNPYPVWKKAKEQIQPEEMNLFYKEFFQDVNDPLFFLQFESVDIGVRGILFFRNTRQGAEELDGTIKVYNRGVYIGENIKELIPKYVNLQNGIIECDNLPLVVSRSSIRGEEQKEDMIHLVNECLSQEVTIAFNDLFRKNRETYEAHWPELNAFVKYGVMQDKIFSSVMSRKIIFMDIYGDYQTIQEYNESEDNTHKELVYYSSDRLDQAHYIEIFKRCKWNALLFDHVIDQPLMYRYEVIHPKMKFIRIDSNIESLFCEATDPEDQGMIAALRAKVTQTLDSRLNDMILKFIRMEQEDISSIIINDESARRMADMMEIYGFLEADDISSRKKQSQSTLLLNLNNKIVRFLAESENDAMTNIVANQLLDLSLLSQQALKPEDMEPFLCRSELLLSRSLDAAIT